MEVRNLNPLHRGDDILLRFTLRDGDDSPIDVSGWAFTFTMKLSPNITDDDAHVQVSTTVTNPVQAQGGIVDIELPNQQTSNLLPTSYHWDLQVVKSGGKITTLYTGKVKVVADITRNQNG